MDRASFFSVTPPECLHRDWVGGRGTGTRHGNVYLSVREKQGIVTGYCCLSATRFTNSDISGCCFTSISKARPPVQSWKSHILIPSKKPDLCYGKNWSPERAAEMQSRSRSQLKGGCGSQNKWHNKHGNDLFLTRWFKRWNSTYNRKC